MNHLIDTNTCSLFLNGRSQSVLKHWQSKRREEIVLCAVVKAELCFGALKGNAPQKHLAKLRKFLEPYLSFPFDDRCAEIYGKIRAELAGTGNPIGPNDFLIAAIALAHGARLITNNVDEFRRVNGLDIEDWHVPAA